MTWFKVDDGFYDHPKVIDLSHQAIALWTLAGCYCARYLTDGYITARQVQRLGFDVVDAGELVASGLWIPEGGDGWKFNDWGEYQPSKGAVEEIREAKRAATRERVRRHRERKKGQSGNAEGNASVTGVTPDPVTPPPSRPVPSRPISTEVLMPTADAVGDFDSFWQAYPRKVGKAAARRAFDKARTRVPAGLIVARCKRMAADPNLPDGNFVPHPATWLNRDGWDDEPYPPPTNGRKPSGTNLYAIAAMELA